MANETWRRRVVEVNFHFRGAPDINGVHKCVVERVGNDIVEAGVCKFPNLLYLLGTLKNQIISRVEITNGSVAFCALTEALRNYFCQPFMNEKTKIINIVCVPL